MQDVTAVASATAQPPFTQLQPQTQIQKVDIEALRHALTLVMREGDTHELRTTGRVFTGYFNTHDNVVKAAVSLSGSKDVDGVFLTVNPVNPALLARTGGQDFKFAKPGESTSADNIVRRACLPIDVDPIRPSGISSTDAEKALSLAKANEVRNYLASIGWGEPVVADSGNGTHLRYRIDLPNTKEARELVDNVLKGLSAKFTDSKVKVDTSTGDAPRILKLYGTLVAKGANMSDRPHRICRVLEDGDGTVVTPEQLEVIAALAPKKTASTSVAALSTGVSTSQTYTKTTKQGLKLTTQTYVKHNWTREEVEAFLDAYSREYTRVDYESGWKWQVTCVNNPDHHAPDAVVYLTPVDGVFGTPTYSCSHDSCKSIEPKFGWTDFVAKLRDANPDATFDYPEDTLSEPSGPVEVEPTDSEMFAAFHSDEDFDNTKPLTFAIAGFLQEDAVTFIGGLAGHAKTFIMLAMAKSLLEGSPLFGHAPFAVSKPSDRVVYLIPESTLTPFKKRVVTFGLEPYFRKKKFLFRTLSHDLDLSLTDPRILKAVKGAHVFLDTAVRFMDGEEVEDSKKFAEMVFSILKSGAKSVTAAHHSSKAFEKQNYMSLENVLRGSGDIGALCATCWGVKQVDEKLNQVIVKNVKPRDFVPCEPFVIQGRPFIDDTGTFRVVQTDVMFDGQNHVYTNVEFSKEMTTVLETYDSEKQKKLMTALSERQKHTPKTVIAEKLGVSDTTVKNWLDEFDKKVKELTAKGAQ